MTWHSITGGIIWCLHPPALVARKLFYLAVQLRSHLWRYVSGLQLWR